MYVCVCVHVHVHMSIYFAHIKQPNDQDIIVFIKGRKKKKSLMI